MFLSRLRLQCTHSRVRKRSRSPTTQTTLREREREDLDHGTTRHAEERTNEGNPRQGTTEHTTQRTLTDYNSASRPSTIIRVQAYPRLVLSIIPLACPLPTSSPRSLNHYLTSKAWCVGPEDGRFPPPDAREKTYPFITTSHMLVLSCVSWSTVICIVYDRDETCLFLTSKGGNLLSIHDLLVRRSYSVGVYV
jgi:hypothetical protein